MAAVKCSELVRPASMYNASLVGRRSVVWSRDFEEVINRTSETEPECEYGNEEQRDNLDSRRNLCY